jgi:NAD(P)-dependent dehydrogenase (short-subunit alcohol dehydrogenase family)
MSNSPNSALVTGAARRIGRALALDLAAHGWNVAVHYGRSERDALEVVSAIRRQGRQAVALKADLADREQVAGLLARASDSLRPLRLLVNNAAVFGYDRPGTVNRQSWDRHMDINLWTPMALTQGLLEQLPDGAEANVVNLIDQRVWNLTPNYTSYSISKAALWALTRHLALALAPRVRVNAIGPGPTLRHESMSEERFDELCRAVPLGRCTSPEEICAAVRFLIDTPAVTGQMIVLDGGQHLGWLLPRQIEGAK